MGEEREQGQLRVLVWNVAGWQPAAKQIAEAERSVSCWLEKHRADLLAVQEAKVRKSTLETDPGGSAFLPSPGFQTFCAPNRQPGQRSGLNGVATFARDGFTLWADPAPLGLEELDMEGRCLLTCHLDFVLFNVYVPATGSGRARLPHKHRFLRALRERALSEHRCGHRVVIAGDFNMAYRPQDVHWRHRLLPLSQLEQRAEHSGSAAAKRVSKLIPRVRSLLHSMEVVIIPAKGKNATQIMGQRQTASYQAKVPVHVFSLSTSSAQQQHQNEGTGENDQVEPSSQKNKQKQIDYSEVVWVPVGKKFDNIEDARMRLGLKRCVQEDESSGERFDAWPDDRLSVEHLSDCLKAIEEPLTDGEERELSECWGESYSAPCDGEWIRALMNELEMVDVYAELHGDARERFTAWDQYTNKRYDNIGARIDFTLVERSMFEQHVARGNMPLPGGNARVHVHSEEAAFRGAVAKHDSGLQYQPAPFDGGGISEAPMQLIEEQYRCDGSGIVYMPPKWSDHAAISLFMPSLPSFERGSLKLQTDRSTKAAQPHMQNKSIKTMFQNASQKRAAESAPSYNDEENKHLEETAQRQQKKQKEPQQMDLRSVLKKK